MFGAAFVTEEWIYLLSSLANWVFGKFELQEFLRSTSLLGPISEYLAIILSLQESQSLLNSLIVLSVLLETYLSTT